MKVKKLMPFRPNLIYAKNIDVSQEWIEKIEDWCLTHGKYDSEGKFTSTFNGDSYEPHQADEFADVLENIYPLEYWSNSWVQVYEPFGYHTYHNHYDVEHAMSGCLYLKSKKSSIWHDPLYPSRITSLPVRSGSSLIWDSAMYHSSPPEHAKRVVVAFNLYEFEEHKFVETLNTHD